MSNTRAHRRALLAVSLGLTLLVGCVERVARVQTRPEGAIVIINDEEVGISPTQFSFTWYGDYDVMLRKPGYETVKTHYRIDPPWYQVPPFDVVAEVMLPVMIRHEVKLPVYELTPEEAPVVSDVVGRATQMRDQTLYESGLE